jgi:thiamine monophosphate synthase
MKNIMESPEVFEAYARIDACYFMMGKIRDDISKPISPIERLVGQVTGHDDAKHKEQVNACIELAEEIIRSKKIVGADTKQDEQFLETLKNSTCPTEHTTPATH